MIFDDVRQPGASDRLCAGIFRRLLFRAGKAPLILSQNAARERLDAPGPTGSAVRQQWVSLRTLVLRLLDRLDPVKRRALTALIIRVAGGHSHMACKSCWRTGWV
jgi:hypothetical protein